MNRKLFLFVLFANIAFEVNAQSAPQVYLDKAVNKLEAGDCDAAQKFYNIYKELSGNPIPSVEAMINDCKNILHIGDIMEVNGGKYTIAYLTENKKHGFAIRDIGVHSIDNPNTLKYLSEQMIPTSAEMDTIYNNNKHIGLTGKYWSSTAEGYVGSGPWKYLFLKDFLTGKTSMSDQRNKNRILIIHRF